MRTILEWSHNLIKGSERSHTRPNLSGNFQETQIDDGHFKDSARL